MRTFVTIAAGALLLCGQLTAQVKQKREVGSFNSLKVSSAIKVVLTMGDHESVTFEAEESVLPKLKAEVNDGELRLYTEDNTHTKKDMIAYVNARQLKAMDVSGAAGVRLTNALVAEKLSIESSGAGELDLDLQVKELEADITGAASLEIKGLTSVLNLEMTGASGFKAQGLSADQVKIKASGASNARVVARKSLKVNATGASKVIYSGEPKDKEIFTSGAASVKAG